MRTPPRLAFIDAIKAIASQLIVLHHLAFYGPISEAASEACPALFSWLYQDARIAVQAFLVVGGYLAAKTLAPFGELKDQTPLALVRKRYFKLVIPFFAAVLLSVASAFVARALIGERFDDFVPAAASVAQLFAHLALLHGVLGFDSLSAGVWYVAIDFQLFALLVALLWLARAVAKAPRRREMIGVALVAALAAGSLFHFNRDAGWDNYAPYFFGAYALGALAYWSNAPGRTTTTRWLAALAALVVLALLVDFRSRIAVALVTALALGVAQRCELIERWPAGAVFAYLGKISYSVFLVHFPILLLCNAIFALAAPATRSAGIVAAVFAWAASLAFGALFYRYVESRSGRWLKAAGQALAPALARLTLKTKP